ncbi:MAG TPA: hypothetical protein PLX66_02390 [Bacilli bacterium]|nr:hypothetical protein [Bacilli bacterium]
MNRQIKIIFAATATVALIFPTGCSLNPGYPVSSGVERKMSDTMKTSDKEILYVYGRSGELRSDVPEGLYLWTAAGDSYSGTGWQVFFSDEPKDDAYLAENGLDPLGSFNPGWFYVVEKVESDPDRSIVYVSEMPTGDNPNVVSWIPVTNTDAECYLLKDNETGVIINASYSEAKKLSEDNSGRYTNLGLATRENVVKYGQDVSYHAVAHDFDSGNCAGYADDYRGNGKSR